MSFVYPWFLWALVALSIPIFIHLFYFRRYKTVFFTNVQFLKEVKEQTSAKNKLKHLLVLAARLLALAFLVLAFAMPYWPARSGNQKQGGRDVSIYFDNSFSMSAESQDVRLLEKARKRAEEIVAAFDNMDKIQVLTADFEGRDQRLLSKDDALQRIREVRSTYKTQNLSKVLGRQQQALRLGQNPNKEIFIISDFQANASDLGPWEDTTANLHLIPLQAVQTRNIAIDTAWFESPVQTLNQPNALIVKVKNYSDTEVEGVPISLDLDGQQRPEGTIKLAAKGYAYDTVNISVSSTGWHEAKLKVVDFPIEFDNDYHFSFFVAPQINILEIHDGSPNRYLQASFSGNAYFKLNTQAYNQLDYAKFRDQDLIILQDLKQVPSGLAAELAGYVRDGGNVLIFPAQQGNVNEYNALLRGLNANALGSWDGRPKTVSFINYDEFVFRDVFEERKENIRLPSTKGNFRLEKKASTGEEVLLRFRDGESFVGKYSLGKGNTYLCSSPLNNEQSDLVNNADIFVPMIYRMALSTGENRKIAYTIGKDNNLESTHLGNRSNEIIYKIGNAAGEFIPEQKTIGNRLLLNINNQIQMAGTYDLRLQQDSVLDKFSFNFDRQESDLQFRSADDLRKAVGEAVDIIEGTYAQDFSTVVSAQSQGTHLWKWCLILTLLFLLAETLLLRLWKS
jgi:hypothetical protein